MMAIIDFPTIRSANPIAPSARRFYPFQFPQQFTLDLRACATSVTDAFIYLGSVKYDRTDTSAGKKIAWLRANAIGSRTVPTAGNITGAIGEWIVLRRVKHLPDVNTVSLVSMAPVCEPDLTVVADQNRMLPKCEIDIKTSSAIHPEVIYTPVSNDFKGSPHFLFVVLPLEHHNDWTADLYFIHKGRTLTTDEAFDLKRKHIDLCSEEARKMTAQVTGFRDPFRTLPPRK